jgi:hypothetical protein
MFAPSPLPPTLCRRIVFQGMHALQLIDNATNINEDDSFRGAAVTAGIVEWTLLVLFRFPRHIKIHRTCCSALWNLSLAVSGSKALAAPLSTYMPMPRVLQYLRDLHGDPELPVSLSDLAEATACTLIFESCCLYAKEFPLAAPMRSGITESYFRSPLAPAQRADELCAVMRHACITVSNVLADMTLDAGTLLPRAHQLIAHPHFQTRPVSWGAPASAPGAHAVVFEEMYRVITLLIRPLLTYVRRVEFISFACMRVCVHACACVWCHQVTIPNRTCV